MTNYLIPLFGDKPSNHAFVERIKQQTTVYDSDDLIVGFYRFDPTGLSQRMQNLFMNQYGLKMTFSDDLNFIEFSQSFLDQLKNQADVSLKTLSLILSYFSLFGLVVRPVSDKTDVVNQMFIQPDSQLLFDWGFWQENLIFESSFYNPFTNAPFEDFRVDSYFSDARYLSTQFFFFRALNGY